MQNKRGYFRVRPADERLRVRPRKIEGAKGVSPLHTCQHSLAYQRARKVLRTDDRLRDTYRAIDGVSGEATMTDFLKLTHDLPYDLH